MIGIHYENGLSYPHEELTKEKLSLHRNPELRKKWREFLDLYKDHPVVFPNREDHIIQNQSTLVVVDDVRNTRINYRKNMRSGPGIDGRGQLPIPNDLFYKRNYRIRKAD